MSAIADPPRTEPDLRCPRCGATIEPDQEWCVECGNAARTRIVAPPSWRLPVAAVATVLVLVAAGLAVAFFTAADRGSQTVPSAAAPPAAAPQPAPSTQPATTPSTSKSNPPTNTTPQTGTATKPTVHGWPKGRSGYTVVLLSTADHRTALQTARGLAASGLVGLARTGEFANLPAGQWIVFAGHYRDRATAAAAASAAQGHGATGAYVQYLTSK